MPRRTTLGKGLAPLLGVAPPDDVLPKAPSNSQRGRAFNPGFYERLRAARLAAGLDEQTVASRLGLTKENYQRFESRALPPHFLIPNLCNVLQISADVLFGTQRK